LARNAPELLAEFERRAVEEGVDADAHTHHRVPMEKHEERKTGQRSYAVRRFSMPD
jgi:hypothetical protein